MKNNMFRLFFKEIHKENLKIHLVGMILWCPAGQRPKELHNWLGAICGSSLLTCKRAPGEDALNLSFRKNAPIWAAGEGEKLSL
jgi:hypothetical protein